MQKFEHFEEKNSKKNSLGTQRKKKSSFSRHSLYHIIIMRRGLGGTAGVGSSKRKRGGDGGDAFVTISRGKKKDGNVLEMFKKTKTKSMLVLEKTKSSKIIIINDKENNEDEGVK